MQIFSLCMRAVKALARLRVCAGSPEPSLLVNAIRTKRLCSVIFVVVFFQSFDVIDTDGNSCSSVQDHFPSTDQNKQVVLYVFV